MWFFYLTKIFINKKNEKICINRKTTKPNNRKSSR